MRRFLQLLTVAIVACVAGSFDEPVTAGAQATNTSASVEARAAEHEAAGRLREAFDLYVEALRALPAASSQTRLMEKILALSAKIGPLPDLPEEAERHFARGQTIWAEAQGHDDLDAAVIEIRKAIRLAPWIPGLTYNLAVLHEQQQYYRSAADALKLYLLSEPDDAEEVRARMYALEAKHGRDKVAAGKEKCALSNGPYDCWLLDEAVMGDPLATQYMAHDFACRKRQQLCFDVAVTTIRVAAAQRFPDPWLLSDAEALRAAGIHVDVDRVPALLASDCRSYPQHCLRNIETLLNSMAKMEHSATNATEWVDTLRLRTFIEFDCSRGRPADCFAAGYFRENGYGVQKDQSQARQLYQQACSDGLTEACKRLREISR